MKVKNDLKDMFKKVIIFDTILAAILYGTTNIFAKNYSSIVLLGLALALLSFISNGIIAEYLLVHNTGKYKSIALIGFLLRIVIIAGIGLVLFKHNKLNVVAYMLGYSSHFISLTLYGINIRNN